MLFRSVLPFAISFLAGSAEASHCAGATVPDYCCILACDANEGYRGNFGLTTLPGTTPTSGQCLQPNEVPLSTIFGMAAEDGCSPLTEGSCSSDGMKSKCSEEVSTGGAAAVAAYAASAGISYTPPPAVTGDPHLALPHGGRADFRGEDKAIYNFVSAKDVAVNVMTEAADFELHNESNPRHKQIHGSFVTQAHIVARTNTGKIVRVSYWADMIGPTNMAWVNGTVDSDPVFKLGPKNTKVIDDVSLTTDYSSLTVLTPEFEISVKPLNLKHDVFEGIAVGRASGERNVMGLHHRLDLAFKLRVAEDTMAVAPHGIIGQGWDKDGKAIDGEKDAFPISGEFTTYAMAKGAIEGVPSDYKVASKYATDFKFSRFDLKAAAPRDVAKLVAKGELNMPKSAVSASDTVGSTEYNFTQI